MNATKKEELTADEVREISWALHLCGTLIENRIHVDEVRGIKSKLAAEWLQKTRNAIKLINKLR